MVNDGTLVKGLWPHLMGSLWFRVSVVLLGFPLLFLLTILKLAFFHRHSGLTSAKDMGNENPVKAPSPAPEASQPVAPSEVPCASASMDCFGIPEAPAFVPATAHRVMQIDEAVVNFGIYAGTINQRITRLVKIRTDRLPWQRARIAFRRYNLADFTPGLAEAAKVPYTFDGAVALTRRDLKGSPAKAVADSVASLPKAMHAMSFDTDASDDKPSVRPTVATGVVTSAGMVKVTRTGGKPYSAFQIVVADGSKRAIFTGVDLLEKFNNGDFGLHDRIHIEQIREQFEVEDGARKSKRQKNTYKIEVLERAQN